MIPSFDHGLSEPSPDEIFRCFNLLSVYNFIFRSVHQQYVRIQLPDRIGGEKDHTVRAIFPEVLAARDGQDITLTFSDEE